MEGIHYIISENEAKNLCCMLSYLRMTLPTKFLNVFYLLVYEVILHLFRMECVDT